MFSAPRPETDAPDDAAHLRDRLWRLLATAALAGLLAWVMPRADAQPVGQPGKPLSAAEVDAALHAAVEGPQRTPAYRKRDAARHPEATLRFFGLRPDQTVIELAPGGGWYTEILAPLLHDRGRLYAAHYPKDAASAENREARTAFERKLAAAPAIYGRVKVGTLALAGTFTDIAPRGGADLVLTFRNIHNWIEDGHLDDTLRASFAVLKPGGVLGVEEHRAAPGTTLDRIIATGYVPEAFVIDRARAAGFEFAGSAEINANPRDTHDHPNGVWSLPPTLRGGEVDREAFLAIGESDRMTLRFVKPLR